MKLFNQFTILPRYLKAFNYDGIRMEETTRNLKTSFWYNVHAPTQLIKPNLLFPILYFFVISTIDSLITPY